MHGPLVWYNSYRRDVWQMTTFTRSELEELWATKPYGEFSRMVKSMKGKKKYRIKTQAIRVVEEVLGEEETVVLSKDYYGATSNANVARNVEALRLRLGLTSWDHKIKYATRCLGEVK